MSNRPTSRTGSRPYFHDATGWVALYALPVAPFYAVEPLVCWRLSDGDSCGIVTDKDALVPAPDVDKLEARFQRYFHYPTYQPTQQQAIIQGAADIGQRLAQELPHDETETAPTG